MSEGFCAGRAAPGFQDAAHVVLVPNTGSCRILAKAAVEARIAVAIIGDAAGGVQFDGLERSEEGPAQTKAVLQGLVEVLGTDHALSRQPESLCQKSPLKTIENEALDLSVDHDRNLLDAFIDPAGLLDGLRRCPRSTA